MCLKLSLSFAERTVIRDEIWRKIASDRTIEVVKKVSVSPTFSLLVAEPVPSRWVRLGG